MDWFEVWLISLAIFVIVWTFGWFGTYTGERQLNRLTDFQLWCFSIFSASLIVALALIAGYFIVEIFHLGKL